MTEQFSVKGKGQTPNRADNKPTNRKGKPVPAHSERSPEMSRKWKDEILTLIYEVYQQIRSHDKSEKRQTEIKSALEDLKTEIQKLTTNLCEHGEGEVIRHAEGKETKLKDKGKPGKTKSTSRTVDLCAAINNVISENVKLNGLLLTCRRELKDIGDQVLSMKNEQGIEAEGKPDNGPDVKKMLEMIQNKNKELSDHLDILDKAINASEKEMHDEASESLARAPSTTGKPLKAKKLKKDKLIAKDKPEVQKELKSHSKSTIVLEAITTINELQAYKRELSDHLDSLDKAIKASEQKMLDEKPESLANKTSTSGKTLTAKTPQIGKGSATKKPEVKKELKSHSKSTIVLEAITTINELQAYKRDLQYNLLQVINFRRQNLLQNSPKSNELERGENQKGKRKRDDDSAKAGETYSDEEFQSSIKWLQIVYSEMQDEKERNKRVLKYIFDATNVGNKTSDQNRGQTEHNEALDSEDAEKVILMFDQRLTDLLLKTKEENNDQVRKLEREVESVKELNSELYTRLSKLAGSKLTDNNPNITNLGDPNRPMKIGESFAELYDNEWTDAMDLCQKHLGPKVNEDQIIENLYKTLMICYSICQEKSEWLIKNARSKFKDVSNELKIEAQEEVFKQIVDSRKLSAEEIANSLLTDVKSLKDEIAKKHLTLIDQKYRKLLLPLPFFENCFKVCWKMVVQTPQMILQAGPRAGEEFDKSIFREYTSSGSKVVFTVWPALYLHKGGPLLTKGVVKVK